MAAEQSINVPDFVEFFAEVRGDPTKHLSNKGEDGQYLVPDVVIGRYAAQLLASKFYSTEWLVGCSPATVLLPRVLTGLGSDNPKRVRQAVNAAFSAELRIITMGMEPYVEWCLQGRPREPKQEQELNQAEQPPQVVGIFEAKAKEIIAIIQELPNSDAVLPKLRPWAGQRYHRVVRLLEVEPGAITGHDISQLEKVQEIMIKLDERREAEIRKGALLRLRTKLLDQAGGDVSVYLTGSSPLKRARRHITELNSMNSLGRPGAIGDLKWALGLLLEKLKEAQSKTG